MGHLGCMNHFVALLTSSQYCRTLICMSVCTLQLLSVSHPPLYWPSLLCFGLRALTAHSSHSCSVFMFLPLFWELQDLYKPVTPKEETKKAASGAGMKLREIPSGKQ